MPTRVGFYPFNADIYISNTDIFNKYRYMLCLELQISLIEMRIYVIKQRDLSN